ncbi:hypothetical protein ACVI1L_006192 [Bradyrhizobium sp. USDA 4516]
MVRTQIHGVRIFLEPTEPRGRHGQESEEGEEDGEGDQEGRQEDQEDEEVSARFSARPSRRGIRRSRRSWRRGDRMHRKMLLRGCGDDQAGPMCTRLEQPLD